MILAEAKDLSYKTGSKYLLKDISWQLHDGEHWVVLGPNGSGKTTLLGALSGYLPAPPEAIRLLDTPVDDTNRRRLCAQTGLVSDAFLGKYYHHENVLDIVLSGASGGLGLTCAINQSLLGRATRLLDALDIQRQARLPYLLLSKGERQKVLLARALIGAPAVLFLDEPCSGLDFCAKGQLLDLLQWLALQHESALVTVTHHFDELLSVYTHALLLSGGSIHSQGPIAEIITSSNMSDFLGQAAQVERTPSGGFALHIAFSDPNKQRRIASCLTMTRPSSSAPRAASANSAAER